MSRLLPIVGILLLVLAGAGAAAWWFWPAPAPPPDPRVLAQSAEFGRTRAQAEAGDIRAAYRLGVMYRDGDGTDPDPAAGVAWLRQAAEAGLGEAQYALGRALETGTGVKRDPFRAAEWYRLAASLHNNADAQLALGQLYFHGRGLAQSFGDAAEWYLKAAAQGQPLALYLVGAMYEEGWGVGRDLVQSYVWYTLSLDHLDVIKAASRRFDPEAARKKVAAQMNRRQVELAEREVERWRARHARRP